MAHTPFALRTRGRQRHAMMETVLSEESEYEDAGPEWQCEDPEAEYDAPVGDEEGAAEATAEGEESKHDDSTDDATPLPLMQLAMMMAEATPSPLRERSIFSVGFVPLSSSI